MPLIQIDDRDVINYYSNSPTSIQKNKDNLLRLKSENLTSRVIGLGQERFKIDLPAISCIGSDIDTIFRIPFMHEFVKMEIKHTDSNGINSTDNITYSISHRIEPNLWMLILAVDDSDASDIIDEYEQYHHEQCQYLLTTNTINTHKLHIAIYVQHTGD